MCQWLGFLERNLTSFFLDEPLANTIDSLGIPSCKFAIEPNFVEKLTP